MTQPNPSIRHTVLLTGATGMVGGLVLADLLRAQIPVAVMIRARGSQSAERRLEGVMRRLERRFSRQLVRPKLIEGDLCESDLGLTEADHRWLSNHCARVVHSAACLSFRPAADHPQNEPFRSNLQGTRHLLEFATSAGIDEWHYISTAFVSGLRSGCVLETEGDVGQEFANDYERSKLQAEQLLKESAAIRSLTIYRPSIVVDNHIEGAMASDFTINGAFSTFETLSATFGLPECGEWLQNLGFQGTERKNIVPADWVARLIVRILRRPELRGKTYHLTSETGTLVSVLDDTFRSVVEQAGTAKRRRVNGSRGPSIDELAAPYVSAFAPYFRDDPVFDRGNLRHAMNLCGVQPARDIGAPEIRELVRNRKAPKDTRAAQSVQEDEVGPWAALAAQGVDAPPVASQKSGWRIGLSLSGAGGGWWTISGADTMLSIVEAVSGDCEIQLHTTSKLWNELLAGQVVLDDAVCGGQLTVECNGSHAWKAAVSDVLVALRAECGRSLARRSTARTNTEVTRVD